MSDLHRWKLDFQSNDMCKDHNQIIPRSSQILFRIQEISFGILARSALRTLIKKFISRDGSVRIAIRLILRKPGLQTYIHAKDGSLENFRTTHTVFWSRHYNLHIVTWAAYSFFFFLQLQREKALGVPILGTLAIEVDEGSLFQPLAGKSVEHPSPLGFGEKAIRQRTIHDIHPPLNLASTSNHRENLPFWSRLR